MNENEPKAVPRQKVHGEHGYRDEVSWDGGRGRQPYANQGAQEQGPDTAAEVEGGNAGDTAGRNLEDLRAVKQSPWRSATGSPRGR